jgi:2-C-methyl-D-erythritol 4-phosphate cytidylyltransferase
MKKEIPKQFIRVHNKSIIVHTIEKFENHPDIDAIAVVCIEAWLPFLKNLFKKHGIKKVKWIVPGGVSRQDSIFNGLSAMSCDIPEDAAVLIHDGVRPLITKTLISDCIETMAVYGNAVTVAPETETPVLLDNMGQIEAVINRDTCFHARTPECFRFDDIWTVYQEARKEGIDMTDNPSLMKHYGSVLHAVRGSLNNIKITTPVDIYVFRALYDDVKIEAPPPSPQGKLRSRFPPCGKKGCMNIALLTVGGIVKRTRQDIPKQFVRSSAIKKIVGRYFKII